jgi:hypothetical protein
MDHHRNPNEQKSASTPVMMTLTKESDGLWTLESGLSQCHITPLMVIMTAGQRWISQGIQGCQCTLYTCHCPTHETSGRLPVGVVTVRLFYHQMKFKVQKSSNRPTTNRLVIEQAHLGSCCRGENMGARSTASSVWRRSWRAESVAAVVPEVVCCRLGVSKGRRHGKTLDWIQNCAIPVQLR